MSSPSGGGIAPPTTSSATPSGHTMPPEQSAPVDLATPPPVKQQPLRIPTVPVPSRPSSLPPRTMGVASGGGMTLARQPLPRPQPTLVAVPKTTPQPVNILQQQQTGGGSTVNKVTLLASTTPTAAKGATPLNQGGVIGQVPRATATTIIRPPTSSYPIIRNQPSGAPPSGTASIRLTTTGGAMPPVQFVPVSLATAAGLRPSGTPVTVKQTFRPPGGVATSISDAVRVTLVQSQGGGAVPKTLTHQGATLTPTMSGGGGGPGGYYKPVTITSQHGATLGGPQKITTTMGQPVRIGPMSSSRMTVMPASQQLQTVSLAPTSHITGPLAPNVLTGSKPAPGNISGRITSMPGKLITVPSGPPAVSMGPSSASVTIQKTNLPPSSGQQLPTRTISLPYGTTQVAAISKPISQAIPVARVCPQPLAAAASAQRPNLVTITSTIAPQGSGTGNVYIARNSGQSMPVAINLPNQQQQQTMNLAKARTAFGGHFDQHKITLPTQPARLVSLPTHPAGGSQSMQHHDQQQQPFIPSSPRPSILGGRDGERDLALPETPPPRPDSRNDDAGSLSSGSTTLSATSSPGRVGTGVGGDHANLSGGEDSNHLQPSPRKKPRKRTLPTTGRWGEDANLPGSDRAGMKRKLPGGNSGDGGLLLDDAKVLDSRPSANYIQDKPHMSLLNSYRHTWKSRHNHFLRHCDVRPKDEPHPTVNELANQRHVLQKVNGWKVFHLTSQMEDIIDVEAELTSRLSSLQKRLEKSAHHDISKDMAKSQELIKANLQRSKVIQDQIKESSDHAVELFDHKSKVTDILHKYMSKRQVKKRDVKM